VHELRRRIAPNNKQNSSNNKGARLRNTRASFLAPSTDPIVKPYIYFLRERGDQIISRSRTENSRDFHTRLVIDFPFPAFSGRIIFAVRSNFRSAQEMGVRMIYVFRGEVIGRVLSQIGR
jgi:hypothetical protein